MQMRYMNGFLRELSENILNHIKILSDWRTKTIRDYVELSFIGFSRSEVGGFGSTAKPAVLLTKEPDIPERVTSTKTTTHAHSESPPPLSCPAHAHTRPAIRGSVRGTCAPS